MIVGYWVNFIIFTSSAYNHEEDTGMIMIIRNLLFDYDDLNHH